MDKSKLKIQACKSLVLMDKLKIESPSLWELGPNGQIEIEIEIENWSLQELRP